MFACRRAVFDGAGRVVGATLLGSPELEAELLRALGAGGAEATSAIGVAGEGRRLLEYLDRLRAGGDLFVVLGSPEGPEDLESAAAALRVRGLGVATREPGVKGSDLVLVEVEELGRAVGPGTVRAAGVVRPVAWGVARPEEHERARSAGVRLFDGPLYRQVRPRGPQDASSSTSAILRLLALLGDDRSSNAEVVEGLRADPGVSYKLLRLVNSSGEESLEASLEFALRVMGRASLHRWLSILLLRLQEDRSGGRDEVILSCLTRGRFGEVLRQGPRSALVRDLPESGGCFLLGLFSRLDVLMGRPMEGILSGLQLHPAVEGALLRKEGAGGALLDIAEAMEAGEWSRLTGLLAAHGVDGKGAGEAWLGATAWALDQVAAPH